MKLPTAYLAVAIQTKPDGTAVVVNPAWPKGHEPRTPNALREALTEYLAVGRDLDPTDPTFTVEADQLVTSWDHQGVLTIEVSPAETLIVYKARTKQRFLGRRSR